MSLLQLLFGEKKEDKSLSDELAHINQEMYKKSAELAERNKTLLLLQKINELILGSITHPEEIAKLVTALLVKEIDFQVVCIMLYDAQGKKLRTLSLSETNHPSSENIQTMPYLREIPLSLTDNVIIQAVIEKSPKHTTTLENVLLPKKEMVTSTPTQDSLRIDSVFVYPLIVRNELNGAMVIGLQDGEANLSEYRRDLINRISELIGIAIDNALLYTAVQAANERLKGLDKLKDEFVSLASHELRTPMSAIRSYLWVILQQDKEVGTLTDKQKTYLERTYVSTKRLIKLVNDMLNVSRIESGRMQITLKPYNIVQIAKEILTEVSPAAQNQHIKVILQEPQTALPLVSADSDKIKEVFMNILGNSLKFTPDGGKITISFSQKDAMVTTHISDTGKGIKKEDMVKLFQKFGMIEGNYPTSSAAQTTGTGLGLYIAKAIIRMHGGMIWVESEGENKGTTFSFSLKEAEQTNSQMAERPES